MSFENWISNRRWLFVGLPLIFYPFYECVLLAIGTCGICHPIGYLVSLFFLAGSRWMVNLFNFQGGTPRHTRCNTALDAEEGSNLYAYITEDGPFVYKAIGDLITNHEEGFEDQMDTLRQSLGRNLKRVARR